MTDAPASQPTLLYLSLMTNVRARFEVIEQLNLYGQPSFASLETAAFHLRKSIEGIAFGCMVALEQGLQKIPREAQGQWNADNVFARLNKRDALAFPEAFIRKDPGPESPRGTNHHICPNPDVNLSVDQLREIYRASHKWLHEWNPYVQALGGDLEGHKAELLTNIPRVWNWIVQHMIGIGGYVFLGILKDPADGQLRVIAAESA